MENIYTLLIQGRDSVQQYTSFHRNYPSFLPFFDSIEYDILERAYLNTRLKKDNKSAFLPRLKQEIDSSANQLFDLVAKNNFLYHVCFC
jgi:hypothetical protein